MAGPIPAFANYADIVAVQLERYAAFARDLIREHPGEKGRALEGIVAGAIRAFLPKRYSIGSGFVVNSKRQISKQLDIVIYDDQTNTPLKLGEQLGVFPIECVYATIEVKYNLTTENLAEAMKSIGHLREMTRAKTLADIEMTSQRADGIGLARPKGRPIFVASRAYIFALESNMHRDLNEIRLRLVELARDTKAHVHGLVIFDRDIFVRRKASLDPDAEPLFFPALGRPFHRLLTAVLADVMSAPVGPAAIWQYLAHDDPGVTQ